MCLQWDGDLQLRSTLALPLQNRVEQAPHMVRKHCVPEFLDEVPFFFSTQYVTYYVIYVLSDFAS